MWQAAQPDSNACSLQHLHTQQMAASTNRKIAGIGIQVYLAILDGIQSVAVKMLGGRQGHEVDSTQMQRFEAELAIMRSARHRNCHLLWRHAR